jgi:hypothetical protein
MLLKYLVDVVSAVRHGLLLKLSMYNLQMKLETFGCLRLISRSCLHPKQPGYLTLLGDSTSDHHRSASWHQQHLPALALSSTIFTICEALWVHIIMN